MPTAMALVQREAEDGCADDRHGCGQQQVGNEESTQRAVRAGRECLKTPGSRSSASLVCITRFDHRRRFDRGLMRRSFSRARS
jgi:hypothetical protein